MKIFTVILFFCILIHSAVYANEYDDKYEIERKEKVEKAKIANSLLSDLQLLSHLKDMFKYMPEDYDEIANESEAKKKQLLDNIRDYYTNYGLSISEQIEMLETSPEMKEFMAKTWFNDTYGVEYAKLIILSLSNQQYETIIETAQDLISNKEVYKKERFRGIVVTDDFPKNLSFIKIESIRIYENSCDIYLYKGTGSIKSIGYTVKKAKNGDWQLYHFNYLKSWDKHLISFK
ncbi:MAG: hypothetical protein L3J83_08765 [Proteobacteria bacterium]|nr:hypothetical protein [Pseudomonadota bacterium]